MELSRNLKDAEWEMRSVVALGWLQRLRGDLDRAVLQYLDVLRRTLEIGDKEKLARVQCDLAYVKSLQGDNESALSLMEQVLPIWQRLCEGKRTFYEDLGIAHHRVGIFYREIGQLDKAMVYFEQAVRIFAELGLDEWHFHTRAQMGITDWVKGDSVSAEKQLSSALEELIGFGTHEVRYYLAQVKWAHADRESAGKMLLQSLSESYEYGDAFYALLVLCALARLMFEYEIEDLSTWRVIERYHDTFRKNFPEASFPLMEGIFATHLGHLAVGQRDFRSALEFYKRGLPQMAAQRNSYRFGDFNLNGQFTFIHSKVIRLLSTEQARTVGVELERIWSLQGLDISHPEVFNFLLRWQQM